MENVMPHGCEFGIRHRQNFTLLRADNLVDFHRSVYLSVLLELFQRKVGKVLQFEHVSLKRSFAYLYIRMCNGIGS